MLAGMGLSSMPVGNADAGSYFNNLVLAASDYGVRRAPLSPFFFLFWLTDCYLLRLDGQRASMVRRCHHSAGSRLDMGVLPAE